MDQKLQPSFQSSPSSSSPFRHAGGGKKLLFRITRIGQKSGGINAKRWSKETRAFTLDIGVSISSGSLGALWSGPGPQISPLLPAHENLDYHCLYPPAPATKLHRVPYRCPNQMSNPSSEPGLLAAAVSGIIDRWWSPLINTMVYRTLTTRFFMPKYLQFKGDSRREEVWEKIFGSFERNFRLILKNTWSFIVKNIFPSFEYSNHNLERN